MSTALREQIPSIAKSLASLRAMEQELTTALSHDQIHRIIKAAEALKILQGDVAEVKAAAEDAILLGNRRIAEELAKVPKAAGRPAKIPSPNGKNLGREATGIRATSRHRLGKLTQQSPDELKATAQRLREQGKDATVTAVVREITHGDKATARADRERELAHKTLTLPVKRYGILVEDFEWDHETWSERGKDRHASNHYVTSDAHTAEEIIERTKDRFICAATSCILFMWATVPHLAIALDVMRGRGFTYKSSDVWVKNKIGTGYWNQNQHEILLIGVRGKPVAPAKGSDWGSSVIVAPRGRHSAKPEIVLEKIEELWPNTPKIELNRRGPARPGWDAWGLEVT